MKGVFRDIQLAHHGVEPALVALLHMGSDSGGHALRGNSDIGVIVVAVGLRQVPKVKRPEDMFRGIGFGLPEMQRLVESYREEWRHEVQSPHVDVLPPLLYGLGNQTGREGALDKEENRVC